MIERIINYIRDKFQREKVKTPGLKVTEVSVMVSKKVSVRFNSCCVSYSVKATLDENDRDYLKALDDLKNELIVKVQEALNGKQNGNGNGQYKEGANSQEAGHEQTITQ